MKCLSFTPVVWSNALVAFATVLFVLPTWSFAQPRPGCPATPHQVVEIRGSDDPARRRELREVLKRALGRDNTTVLLGADVRLDFSDLPPAWFPIQFGQCVTLRGVAFFKDLNPPLPGGGQGNRALKGMPLLPDARSPRSRGPVLRFGKQGTQAKNFLEIRCFPEQKVNDGARISGFRLYGATFGPQSSDEIGIRITRCIDIEISNMEIAGWGGMGIDVKDDPGPDQAPGGNGPGGRISSVNQVRIHDNFFHHNQHEAEGIFGGHALGYGVETSTGAWAQISRNVFDFNRHAIAASSDTGGYAAELNLVLKGGGHHGTVVNSFTHSFDVHGSDCWTMCGEAGVRFWYGANAFQYRKDNAIKIRGKPKDFAMIFENVFPHPGLENDVGDDAIDLQTHENVVLGPANIVEFDSFGRYGVCDFDGDGMDDLFLPTGASWWFSSSGQFHWSYLNDKEERLHQVRLGYFDNDQRCDVLAEQGGQWVMSSGGVGGWQPLGTFGAPLAAVEFGRFDPGQRDNRPHVTRRTTHAFQRAADGQWLVTPLSEPDWKPAQSSSVDMNQLRFGDFTGDGVTDVLAVVGGRWAISESAVLPWRRLNANLGTAVGDLFVANMDAGDNIDDILRLERRTRPAPGPAQDEHVELTWWRSRNGTEPWRAWKTYSFTFRPSSDTVDPQFGFVGRFGPAPGGATLVIDQGREGRFYSRAQTAMPEWRSVFAY